MALRISSRSTFPRYTVRCLRCYSSDAPAPPLLLKIRNDLKTAMREKNKERLEVLRGMLADVTNKQKELQSGSGLKTDVQILALLQKRIANSKKAAHSFGEAGRTDLKDREDSQIKILDEYADSVEVMDGEQIRATIGEVIQRLSEGSVDGKKLQKNEVIKALLAPGGAFEGKPVDKAQVMQYINLALGDTPKPS